MDSVYPLSFTQPNWDSFIKVCQEVLGYSPTRGLDAEGIKVDSPSSFLGCLDLENQPKFSLRTGRYRNNTFRHVHAGFIVIGQEEWVTEFACCTSLDISHKPNHKKCIIILSGTMEQWYDAIITCSSRLRSKEIRETINIIQKYFERGGFNELWSKHEKLYLADETFVLQGGQN